MQLERNRNIKEHKLRDLRNPQEHMFGIVVSLSLRRVLFAERFCALLEH